MRQIPAPIFYKPFAQNLFIRAPLNEPGISSFVRNPLKFSPGRPCGPNKSPTINPGGKTCPVDTFGQLPVPAFGEDQKPCFQKSARTSLEKGDLPCLKIHPTSPGPWKSFLKKLAFPWKNEKRKDDRWTVSNSARLLEKNDIYRWIIKAPWRISRWYWHIIPCFSESYPPWAGPGPFLPAGVLHSIWRHWNGDNGKLRQCVKRRAYSQACWHPRAYEGGWFWAAKDKYHKSCENFKNRMALPMWCRRIRSFTAQPWRKCRKNPNKNQRPWNTYLHKPGLPAFCKTKKKWKYQKENRFLSAGPLKNMSLPAPEFCTELLSLFDHHAWNRKKDRNSGFHPEKAPCHRQ